MRKAWVPLLGALLLSGCGYTLVGHGIYVDPSIHRIGVPLFKDRTGTTSLDQTITEGIIEELMKRGHFEVVPSGENVDAIVEGEILNYKSVPIAVAQLGGGATTGPQATRYAVTVVAHVTFKKVGEQDVIWEGENMSAREESDVGETSTAYFDRTSQTIQRLSSNFARSVVAAMFEGF